MNEDDKPKQTELFSLEEGIRARDKGMGEAADNRPFVLAIAQSAAREIADGRDSRECCADDVQGLLIDRGYKPEDLGNAAGSLFKNDPCWEFVRWGPSRRVSNHGRSIRVWRYKG